MVGISRSRRLVVVVSFVICVLRGVVDLREGIRVVEVLWNRVGHMMGLGD